MQFNFDSIGQVPFVVTAVLVGGLFTYTFYNIFTTRQILKSNESLVNIVPSLDTIS
jgi:hypothetical protein